MSFKDMSKLDINELVPGRELDKLILEEVLGWKNVEWRESVLEADGRGDTYITRYLPAGFYGEGPNRQIFSKGGFGISHRLAWEVVTAIGPIQLESFNDGSWFCRFKQKDDKWPDGSCADSMELAVCLAALKHVRLYGIVNNDSN